MIKKIDIQIIPDNQQRYPTCGDYFIIEDTLHIRVSDMGNMFYEILVVIHELIEWLLITKKGVTIKDIDAFDIQFEKDRAKGLHTEDEEPGDSPLAPYCKEHKFATFVEKLMAKLLKINWKEYDKTVMKCGGEVESKEWAGGV